MRPLQRNLRSIVVTIPPAWRQEGEELTTPPAITTAILTATAVIAIATAFTLPLWGEPPILPRLQLAFL